MKKLIAVLASAVAFGAFAEYPTGINFDSASTGSLDITQDDEGGDPSSSGKGRFWYGDAAEVTATITEYAQQPGQSTVISEESANVNFLALETGTAPLYRTLNNNLTAASADDFTGTSIGDGLYIDTLVQFTAGDPDMSVNDDLAKLGVWLCGNDSEGEPVATTNFVVRAGYISAGGTIVPTNYVMNSIADLGIASGDWVRLTVKAISNIAQEGSYVGFVVFVNGTPLTYSTAVDAFDSSVVTLNTVGAKFYNSTAHSLLPSLILTGDTKSTLSCVGFSGTGAVDDIAFTDQPPVDAAKDVEQFTLAWGANVASVSCYAGNEVLIITNNLVAAGSVALDIPEGAAVTVTATYANNYAAGVWTATGADVIAGGFENIEKDALLTVTAVAMNYAVTIGNNTVYAETLAQAIALASANGGTIVVRTSEALAEGAEIDADGQTIVLDLAGQTLSSDGDAVIFLNSGSLVITNSTVEVGAIVSENEDDPFAIVIGGASALDIYGGKFVGIIYPDTEEEYTIALYGGTFADLDYDGDPESLFYLNDSVEEGFEATPEYDDDLETWFFTVAEAAPAPTTYEVSFTYGVSGEKSFTTNVVAGTLVSDLVPEDVEVTGKTISWTPAFDGETAVADDDLAYTASYDDITYSVKFVYGVNGETTNAQSVVYGTVPTAPDAATVAVSGYTFTGWDATVVEAYADAVYTAQYEKDAEEVIVVPGGEPPVVDESKTNELTTAVVQPAITLTSEELTAYQSLLSLTFTEVSGGYAVGAELDAAKATSVVTALDTAVSDIAIDTVAAGTASEVTVNVVPGLYYGVATGTTLESMAVANWVQATSGQTTMKLTVPAQQSTATAGFYRVEASATAE